MKKVIFTIFTVLIGIVGIHCTLVAGLTQSKHGEYFFSSLLSFSGVVLPVIALEIAKRICFRRNERSVYFFDRLGVYISGVVLFILIYTDLSRYDFDNEFELSNWMRGFLPLQLPWIVSLIIQIFLSFKKTNKQ